MKLITLFLVLSLFLSGCFHDKNQPVKDTTANIVNSSGPQQNVTNRTIIVIKNGTTAGGLADNGTDVTPPPADVNSKVNPGYTSTPDERFAIYFINVGEDELQGDAILIKKGDFDMLIDAGNVRSSNKVIDFLKSKAVDDMEVLISTHADDEHYGGMQRVLDEFGVEEFWWPGKLYGDSNYDALLKRVNSENITIKEIKRGDKFSFNGINFQVLNPSATKSFGDRDNDAIALKVTQKEFCALLTSDILFGAQSDVANALGIDLRCNILQMPGHGLGAANSQIDVFLLKVSPKDAIISGSADDPSQDPKGTRYITYEKLRLRNVRYYENYKNGTVRIQSDGSTYAIDQLPN